MLLSSPGCQAPSSHSVVFLAANPPVSAMTHHRCTFSPAERPSLAGQGMKHAMGSLQRLLILVTIKAGCPKVWTSLQVVRIAVANSIIIVSSQVVMASIDAH